MIKPNFDMLSDYATKIKEYKHYYVIQLCNETFKYEFELTKPSIYNRHQWIVCHRGVYIHRSTSVFKTLMNLLYFISA